MFSMTIGWPSSRPSAPEIVRAVWSTAPPGANGTIRRIGWLGYAWLQAGAA
ncbi:hypothetical protein [Cupriavidus sp. H18C1]|uniref:hypothetical protein n=1 Tax=Cupriavidus sp. H18C1 TaxID=3241601 RepID=UPI003BB8E52D